MNNPSYCINHIPFSRLYFGEIFGLSNLEDFWIKHPGR